MNFNNQNSGKSSIENCMTFTYILIMRALLNPLRGSCCTLFSFPALRTGLFKLNHIRGFNEKILKGFNPINRGCKPVVNWMMRLGTPRRVQYKNDSTTLNLKFLKC